MPPAELVQPSEARLHVDVTCRAEALSAPVKDSLHHSNQHLLVHRCRVHRYRGACRDVPLHGVIGVRLTTTLGARRTGDTPPDAPGLLTRRANGVCFRSDLLALPWLER